MLMNVLGQYYKQILELVQLMSSPMVTPELRTTGELIIKAAGELVDRTMRTFDQIRDPEDFVIKMSDIAQQSQGPNPQQLAQLVQALSQQNGVQPNGNGAGPAPMALPPPQGAPPTGQPPPGGMLQ
jgi:2-phospho-L-lactate guanylyltransferase (CobY/MobA/RfbA family)